MENVYPATFSNSLVANKKLLKAKKCNKKHVKYK